MDERLKDFKCEMCGNCCKIPGFVRINDEEAKSIAVFLGMAVDAFVDEYTDIAPDRRSLVAKDKDNGECIFLDDRDLCVINDVKPEKCRTFPFEWVNGSSLNYCKGLQNLLRESRMKVKANAKINVTLDVFGKRPDGFHDLRSIVMPIDLCDDVEVSLSPSSQFSVDVETISDGIDISMIGPKEKNLAYKAAEAFKRYLDGKGIGFLYEVSIKIVKRIPLGGGLGGGSADGAAVLRALRYLAKDLCEISTDDAILIASQIGSDVPALLLGGAVLMEGRGEKVRRIDGFSRSFDILLVNPGVHVSTPLAYKAFDELTLSQNFVKVDISRNCRDTLAGFSALLSNDLEKPVFGLYPKIAELVGILKDGGAKGVLMSGSGATVFALVENRLEADNLIGLLSKGYWHAISRTVPDGVMAAHGPLEA